MSDTVFWDDPDKAQIVVGEANLVKGRLIPFLALEDRASNLNEVIELAKETDDIDPERPMMTFTPSPRSWINLS